MDRLFFSSLFLIPVVLSAFFCFITSRDRFKLFRRFVKYEIIGILCSTIPFLHFGILLGWSAYTTVALVLARLTEEELYEQNMERKSIR